MSTSARVLRVGDGSRHTVSVKHATRLYNSKGRRIFHGSGLRRTSGGVGQCLSRVMRGEESLRRLPFVVRLPHVCPACIWAEFKVHVVLVGVIVMGRENDLKQALVDGVAHQAP